MIGEITEIAWSAPLVVAARIGVVARGGGRARRELRRMVTEKVDVVPEVARAVAGSWSSPRWLCRAAVAPVHRRVRANRRRLLGR
ncbi:hypothetical protein WIS52_23350 [Pseudonocardia nematodicida]|uniref:Uncharacterized protein n=1 Tax=Pseudonocardia nematodicida TaxID=1206997 RepID=A0ABV1KG42_9PSEU